MVFFSVLAFCGFMQDFNIPFVLAFILAAFLMVIVGLCTERLVLRPLMNASEDTVLKATIGLGYVLEGLAQAAWGVEVRRLDLGIGDFPVPWIADNLKLFISALDITAGLVAAIMIIGLFLLFKYTKISISDVANISINETLTRTIITSVTTLLALVSIYILGGEILRGFSFAMILGVIIGTYSSIYVASSMILALGISKDFKYFRPISTQSESLYCTNTYAKIYKRFNNNKKYKIKKCRAVK